MSASSAAGEALVAIVRRLAWPRRAGSDGDRSVRRELAAALAAAGLDAEEDGFSFTSGPALMVFRAAFLLVALANLLVALGGRVAALLAAVGLLAVGGALLVLVARWDGLFGLAAPGHPGRKTTANSMVRTGDPRPRRRLVLVAHHDSKSQNLPFLVRGLAAAFLALGFLGQGAVTALLAGGLGQNPAFLAARLACAVGAVGAVLLAGLTFGNRSPGALDNGGSVAVVLETVKALADSLPRGTEVIAVFTGAEEDLLVGARVLLRRLGPLPAAPCRILNLDGVGAGGPVGLLGPRRLRRWAEDVARARGIPVRALPALPGAATDALVLGREGREVLTLSSSRPNRAVRAIHTPRDLPENLDPAALAQARGLLEALARDFLEGGDGS
ncbi:MAG: M28 family peptidase [Acidobacteriota bacterium]|nr:M28 family peptidase [Acidobacteriota bacterium]MDQ7088793.1 M28 family peptidase [Acidobacteriota bacterium]